MKLVDMKMTKKEAKEEMGAPTSAVKAAEQGPRYPYGLEIRLDTDSLKKLGIDLDSYPLGAECTIEAKAIVTDKGEHQRLNGKERLNLELQVTELAIGEDKKAKKDKKAGERLNELAAPNARDNYEE